jgi:FkbM family methyltransferase
LKNFVRRLKRATWKALGAALSFEEQIYCSVVRRDDTCYDVGAQWGSVALLLARLAGPNGRVVAFEPVWPMYTTLCARARRAGRRSAPVVTVPFGLYSEENVATVQVPDGNFGMGSLAAAADWSNAHPGAAMASYECRVVTLDGFLRSSKVRGPDFMKIDVEGAELFVLRGAAGFFDAGHRPLMLIEIFAPWERAFGYGPWEVLSSLVARGYRFLFACPGGLVEHEPKAARPFPPEYTQGYNVLAYCPSLHASRIAGTDKLRAGGSGRVLSMTPPPVANTLG